MSTYTALHVQSTQAEALQNMLSKWLKTTHRAESVTIERSTSLEEVYGEKFIVGERLPTVLALEQNSEGWCIVHYNSFSSMQGIADQISKALSCLVVVVMAQSVSEAYFISVHREGRTLRVLEWGGDVGEWTKQAGQPLPFEQEPLGHNIGSNEEPFFVFEREAVIDYCSQLNLQLWSDDGESAQEYILMQRVPNKVMQMLDGLVKSLASKLGAE